MSNHKVRYLVTGAAGSIGSAIMDMLGEGAVAVDNDEAALFRAGYKNSVLGDIRDPRFIKHHRPHTVIHCAAYKHVPFSEESVDIVAENNVTGTQKLLHACEDNSVERFLFVSTDKAAQPCSTMGLTKALGEKLVMASRLETKICLRFGNIYGSSGSVVETFERLHAEGKPLTVTHKDCTRYFMEDTVASRLIVGALDLESGIYALNCGEAKSIDEYARSISDNIEYVGLRFGEKIHETFLNDNEMFENEDDTYRKIILKE